MAIDHGTRQEKAASNPNAEVMSITSKVTSFDRQRFVYIGSLARGALLGHDVTSLNDPQKRRFQDVDVIDRDNVLIKKYTVQPGKLDAMHTMAIHPVEPGAIEWGLYDYYDRSSQQAIVTFSEKCLGLQAIRFSALYPEETINVPSAPTLIALSNLYQHTNNLPKHQDQLRELEELKGTLDPEFADRLNTYLKLLELKYPLSPYLKVRKAIFNTSPSLALSVQDGAFSAIGKTIRSIRNTGKHDYEEIIFN